MRKATKERILKKLDRAQQLVNEAFDLLDDCDHGKCDVFSGLTCDVDEAISEVKDL